MNILQKLIVKYCKLRCKPYLNHYGYATLYFCEKIIGTTNIPFWIYKYQLIALSYYTQSVDIDTRSSLLLSIINQTQWFISHKDICKKLIYYLYAFPDYGNYELKIIYRLILKKIKYKKSNLYFFIFPVVLLFYYHLYRGD